MCFEFRNYPICYIHLCCSAFQLLFTFIPYPGLDMFGFSQLKFNLFTAPAFLACLMNIVGAVVLLTCFTEHYAGLNEAESAEGIELGKQRNAGKVEVIRVLWGIRYS